MYSKCLISLTLLTLQRTLSERDHVTRVRRDQACDISNYYGADGLLAHASLIVVFLPNVVCHLVYLCRLTSCLAKMGGGCLGNPGASTVDSQPLDNKKNAPIAGKSPLPSHEPPFQATVSLTDSVEGKIKGRVSWGKAQKLTMKPLQTPRKNS